MKACYLFYRNLFLIWVILLPLGSCKQRPLERFQLFGSAFGTTYNLIYIHDAPIEGIEQKIDSLIQEVNSSMSTYDQDSDISRINRGEHGVKVDAMFQEVLARSKQVYKATNGIFDPTIGILVNAWGFGPNGKMDLDSLKVDSLMQYVGLDKVRLNPQNQTVVKDHPQVFLDFNAIAKGYAIDRLGFLFSKLGLQNYLIEVGGEILTSGSNIMTNKPWKVGVDSPVDADDRGSAVLIHLTDKAMASSGNYRKFYFDKDSGKKYVHTIDAKTGYPKISNVLAATVIAEDCATADAYATTFMAMDLEDSKTFLKNNRKLEAFIIYLDEKGDLQQFATLGFQKLVIKH